jgi:hypothetical protein
MVQGSNSDRNRDFSLRQIVQTGSGVHQAIQRVPAGLTRGQSGRCVHLTTHLHLVPKLKTSGAIPLPRLHSWLSDPDSYKALLYERWRKRLKWLSRCHKKTVNTLDKIQRFWMLCVDVVIAHFSSSVFEIVTVNIQVLLVHIVLPGTQTLLLLYYWCPVSRTQAFNAFYLNLITVRNNAITRSGGYSSYVIWLLFYLVMSATSGLGKFRRCTVLSAIYDFVIEYNITVCEGEFQSVYKWAYAGFSSNKVYWKLAFLLVKRKLVNLLIQLTGEPEAEMKYLELLLLCIDLNCETCLADCITALKIRRSRGLFAVLGRYAAYVRWLFTDVSGQSVGPVYQKWSSPRRPLKVAPTVFQKDGWTMANVRCVTTQKMEDLV